MWDRLEQLSGEFDVIYLDADKAGYVDYYERIMQRGLLGKMLVVDNVLWGGAVSDPERR